MLHPCHDNGNIPWSHAVNLRKEDVPDNACASSGAVRLVSTDERDAQSEDAACRNRDAVGHMAYSIGYEGKSVAEFLESLTRNCIERLVDVRENPFSFKRGFSKHALEGLLASEGIEYVHMPQLGTDRTSRAEYRRTRDFGRLAGQFRIRLTENESSYVRLRTMIGDSPTVLMCFEDDHATCHRSILAERLEDEGVKVVHLCSGRRRGY